MATVPIALATAIFVGFVFDWRRRASFCLHARAQNHALNHEVGMRGWKIGVVVNGRHARTA